MNGPAAGTRTENRSDEWDRLFEFFARDEQIAVVQLDRDLVVVSAIGARWLDAVPGSHGSDVLPFLSGLEETLGELQPGDRPLVLANIGLAPLARESVKVTGQIFREPDGYLVSLMRIASQDELEFEVTRQVRARRVAEAELRVAEQALLLSAERLATANEALSRANAELDSFAHVISHDLKAPLRAIRMTLETAATRHVVVDESEPHGDGDAGRNAADGGQISLATSEFERLHSQAARMSSMISGLLTFAQAGGGQELAEPLDTGALVARIVASMPVSPLGADDGMRFERIGSWPTIVTAVEPFDVVLRNLLSNAVKHHDRTWGTVKLIARDVEEGFVYSVEDDGPGIPPDAQRMVFKPFRTSDGVVSNGDGLGLALVERICRQNGASVWLDSPIEGGRGTRVSVRWMSASQRNEMSE